jgi:hypothetical protein
MKQLSEFLLLINCIQTNTVKPVYNSLGYNEAHRFHR